MEIPREFNDRYTRKEMEFLLLDTMLQLNNARWREEKIRRSLSWRLTAPFRAVYEAIADLIQLAGDPPAAARLPYTPTPEDRLRAPGASSIYPVAPADEGHANGQAASTSLMSASTLGRSR